MKMSQSNHHRRRFIAMEMSEACKKQVLDDIIHREPCRVNRWDLGYPYYAGRIKNNGVEFVPNAETAASKGERASLEVPSRIGANGTLI